MGEAKRNPSFGLSPPHKTASLASRHPIQSGDDYRGCITSPEAFTLYNDESNMRKTKKADMAEVNKVVLAFSGGLDTSVILKWLQDTYQCEVVTFTADIGQGEEVEPARAKAKQLGVRRYSSRICAKSSCVISFFPCSAPIQFMRGNICWVPVLPAH